MGVFPPDSLELKGMKLEGQTRKRWLMMRRQRVNAIGGQRIRSINRPRRVMMSRSKHPDGSRRSSIAIQRRIKTLRNLIPNTKSTEVDGLFRETVDYILSLQTKVRFMQTMVQVLTGSNDV